MMPCPVGIPWGGPSRYTHTPTPWLSSLEPLSHRVPAARPPAGRNASDASHLPPPPVLCSALKWPWGSRGQQSAGGKCLLGTGGRCPEDMLTGASSAASRQQTLLQGRSSLSAPLGLSLHPQTHPSGCRRPVPSLSSLRAASAGVQVEKGNRVPSGTWGHRLLPSPETLGKGLNRPEPVPCLHCEGSDLPPGVFCGLNCVPPSQPARPH